MVRYAIQESSFPIDIVVAIDKTGMNSKALSPIPISDRLPEAEGTINPTDKFTQNCLLAPIVITFW